MNLNLYDGHWKYQLYNNFPSYTIANAAYNVSGRSLLEADVTGRGYTPMLQTALLIASFIGILAF
jgi:hypothetical protein